MTNTQENKKCCEKCLDYEWEGDGWSKPEYEDREVCRNRQCECHQQNQEKSLKDMTLGEIALMPLTDNTPWKNQEKE